ncbi:putative lipo protein [Coniella lustricola]|uniref:Putative lipo protein n=1 Tax=Coniella lustricola TaxID=2025994 RepID=A0A2T3ANP6_9PEZI|nr:putative lipo protein [Coniella lustricola]
MWCRIRYALALGCLALLQGSNASADATKSPQYQALPSLREQASLLDGWTAERKALIPGILSKYNVDAWLMSQREYAEDTVFWALKSFTQFSARRRTTQLFLANATNGAPSAYSWIDNTPLVWSELKAVLQDQQPRSIALNTHSELAFSGGLHAGELNAIEAALGLEWTDKFVLEPMIAVELVATMVDSRLDWYRKMMETAWAIIDEAFSSRVIHPGVTTAQDVEWWMRDKIQALNYTTWFQPSVSILTENDCSMCPSSTGQESTVPRLLTEADFPAHLIQYGDILHCDFGVTALGLNTDTQHLAYVLQPGQPETEIPDSVLTGLQKANRLQDITRHHMKIGMTGNEILKNIRAQMKDEEIQGKIYCHATGEFGHSAGTVIGMTNLQDEVPFLGDLPLLKNTYYSIELYAEHYVPEKNMTVLFPQEEDVYWSEKSQSWEWVYGRQSQYLFVHSASKDQHMAAEIEL